MLARLTLMLAVTALLAAQPEQPVEPWLLKQMMAQSGAETRLTLLDQYRLDFQKAELIPWAFDQICETIETDRALAAAEHLLALDPREIEVAQKALKVAEKTKDPALVQKWAQTASRAAKSVLDSPQAGKDRADLARSVLAYTDYLAYSEVAAIADPARKRECVEEFLRIHIDSTYKAAAEDLYLETWRQSGDAKKTLEAARKILAQDENNVAALTVVAESYMESDADPKRLVTYATRILDLLDRQPVPAGPAGPDWSKRKAQLAGRAHWMIGSASMQLEKFRDADKSIRAALPFLKGDNRLTSAALFYLGWANYRMGRLPDAIRFNRECTLIKGPFREHAEKNLRVILAETASTN